MALQLKRIPQTDDELYWWVQLRFGVTIPRTKVCADHVAPFTAFADAFFARNSIDPDSDVRDIALWHGSRGLSGKSFMLSILAVAIAELLGSDVNLLGGSLAQSMNIHEHVDMALDYENAPVNEIKFRTNTKIIYENKAKVRPLTASQKTVRGPHPPRLLLDEIDEMDLKILDAALGQPLPQLNMRRERIQPYTVMCSTWQNPQGTFTEIRKRAEEKGYPVYQWCFLESANEVDGWLSRETIEAKRRSIPRIMWETEYELNEPSIGNRAFDTASVDRMFSVEHVPVPELVPLRVSGLEYGSGWIRARESKDFEEFTYANPIRGAEYGVAADWAKERDYTVIGVGRFDVFPYQLVYWVRVNRRPYPTMVGMFNKAIERYRASASIHDSTGVGNAVADYVNIRTRGFTMTGEKRASMLTELISSVESGHWRVPKIPTAYGAFKYAQSGDLFAPSPEYRRAATAGNLPTFHLPDEVAMFGLLNHLVRNRAPLVGPPTVESKPEDQSALQRILDPPTTARRVGDVVRHSEREQAYSLGV